jgi:hypothetical protein
VFLSAVFAARALDRAALTAALLAALSNMAGARR